MFWRANFVENRMGSKIFLMCAGLKLVTMRSTEGGAPSLNNNRRRDRRGGRDISMVFEYAL